MPFVDRGVKWTPGAPVGPTQGVYRLTSGPWIIVKWFVGETPHYSLHRHKGERWPTKFGFATAQEAMDLAEQMEKA